MRRLFVALLVALVAVLLTACGSSDTTTDAQPAQPGAAAPAGNSQPGQPGVAVPPGQAPVAASTASADKKPEVPRKFEASADTPVFFQEALKKKKPILVVFYNADEAVSKLVIKEANSAYKHYEKSALLLLLEANKSEANASLAHELGVDFIPYVATFDRRGTIVFERTGYIDSKVVELALYKASTR